MKLTNAVLVAAALIASSGCGTFSRDAGTIQLSRIPEICESFRFDTNESLMISSGQISPACDIVVEGINFTVAVDDMDHVIAIATSDDEFQTEEGLRVGSSLSQVERVTEKSPMKEPGFGYLIELPSGWTAGFFLGESGTSFEPESDSRISWFFRRATCN